MTRIYLLSPEKFDLRDFSKQLINVLKTGIVPVFQLRIKNYQFEEHLKVARELKKICNNYSCKFIINDSFDIAREVGADGVHLGAGDGIIAKVRKESDKNFIIGASCYDSRDLAILSIASGADYVSFGTFFKSNTKNSIGKPNIDILNWAHEITDAAVVAIGGINEKNCKLFVDAKADFIAVISCIWSNEKYRPEIAVQRLNEVIEKRIF